jgi:hypothetical protein
MPIAARAGPAVDWCGCTKERLMLEGKDLSGANWTRAPVGTGFNEPAWRAPIPAQRIVQIILQGLTFRCQLRCGGLTY